MAEACIFCGRVPVTETHIFRQAWLSDCFPYLGRFGHRHIRTEPGTEDLDYTWWRRAANLTTDASCADCNSGWMNVLDHQAEDLLLTDAVHGFGGVLETPEARATVARWCALIAILLDQRQHAPRVEATTRAELYAKHVPRGVRVWLIRTEPPVLTEDIASATLTDMTLENDVVAGYAYFVTFRVGHLIAQVLIPTKRTPEEIEFDRVANSGLIRQLWPDLLRPFVWPPPETLPWEQVEEVTRAFRYRST